MKTFLLAVALTSVSFLAVCRAETDEFSIFEDSPPAKTTPSPTASPLVAPPSNPVQGRASQVPKTHPPTTVKVAPPTTQTPAQKIEALKTAIRKDPKNISLIEQLAEELYKNKEYEKVTALLWKYIEKVDRPGLLLLARAHEQRQEPDQMIKALNILTSKDPKDYDAYYLLGNAYAIKKKDKETLDNYKSALDINPQFEPAYLGLVKLYERLKNLYELRLLYQDMIQAIGPREEYMSKLCEINTRDGVFEAAISKCREALQKNPNDADSYVNLGLSQKGTGDTALAEKTLKTAADKFPKSEFAQISYAKVLEDQKNFVDAYTYYKSAAGADDKSARAWAGVANCALELQKFEISLLSYKKACRLDKKYATAFRHAASQLSGSKNMDWSKRFSEASEECSYGD